jgi:hypothetical protein
MSLDIVDFGVFLLEANYLDGQRIYTARHLLH